MQTLPVPIAMRTAIGVILIIVAVGIVICALGRVTTDAVAWYKDHMTDPYSDLRKKAKEARKPRRTLEEIVGDRHIASSDDDNSKKMPPGIL